MLLRDIVPLAFLALIVTAGCHEENDGQARIASQVSEKTGSPARNPYRDGFGESQGPVESTDTLYRTGILQYRLGPDNTFGLYICTARTAEAGRCESLGTVRNHTKVYCDHKVRGPIASADPMTTDVLIGGAMDQQVMVEAVVESHTGDEGRTVQRILITGGEDCGPQRIQQVTFHDIPLAAARSDAVRLFRDKGYVLLEDDPDLPVFDAPDGGVVAAYIVDRKLQAVEVIYDFDECSVTDGMAKIAQEISLEYGPPTSFSPMGLDSARWIWETDSGTQLVARYQVWDNGPDGFAVRARLVYSTAAGRAGMQRENPGPEDIYRTDNYRGPRKVPFECR